MRGWLYNHVCFEVADIESAASTLSTTLGAGPFFLREHDTPEEVTDAAGGPCRWDHSHALGAHGSQLIELNQNHVVEPNSLRAALQQSPVGHIAYTVADLNGESARLEQAEMPLVLRSHSGPVTLAYHHSPIAGLVELLQDSPFMSGYRDAILAEAGRWDGTRPLRSEDPTLH